jgi:hypothetical protein
MLTAFLIAVQPWVGFLGRCPWLMGLPSWSARRFFHLPNLITIFLFCKKPGLGLLSLFLSEVKPTGTLLIYVELHVDFLLQEHILSERYALTGIAISLSPRWGLCYVFAKGETGIG